MAGDVSISFRIDQKKAKKLEALAKATDRPKSWLLEQALDEYLQTQAWQISHVKEALAHAGPGETIEHDKMKHWLLSWGTNEENEPPQ